ncbi:MAG: hypothetical protein KA784_08960, partial [Aquabacterium sp.]|nr:hypothetical protein [Aquabacterium sp.]
MPRPSQLRRCSWALALLACLGSAHAAWMPDGPDADAPPSSTHRVLEAFVQVEPACSGATLSAAVHLIYEQDAPAQALALAQQCVREAHSQGNAVKRLIAVRIQALLAMRFRDLDTLHQAGQALIQQRVLPEYVPDGHMCLAFTCLAQGDTQCARRHLTEARTQFTSLQIDHALDQLAPLEQALLHM